MKGITEKLREIEEMREDLDSHIWLTFSRYIKMERILFSSPDDWQIDDDHISFYGSDGCMGCYDSMSTSIPIRFFEDPDTAFAERAEEIKSAKKQEKKNRAQRIKRQERKEFERLKEKFNE